MKKIVLVILFTCISNFALAKSINTGTYYVKENVLEERLAPSASGKITNKIYRRQKVDVLEVKNGWARVSKYYDGVVEGEKGTVARWIRVDGLASSRPAELAQPPIKKDNRIADNAFPKVGENNLNAQDIKILHAGATKYLNSGQCSNVEFGDKSVSKSNTYYINCGGPNIFFTSDDVR